MKRGTSESGAMRAHLQLTCAAAIESPPPSLARRTVALLLALAYLVAAPLLLVPNAFADDRQGDLGSAVLKGSSGPGSGPDDDADADADDRGVGDAIEDNDDGVRDEGTSAKGEESVATTGGVQSTHNDDGDNTAGRKDGGTSLSGRESHGTTCGQQSTHNRDGDNTDGEADNGTSRDGARAAGGGESRGTTGGMDSSWIEIE